MTRLLCLRRAELGSEDSLIALGATSEGHLIDFHRHLSIDGAQVAKVGFGCDTCGLFFELADTEVSAEALAVLRASLADGLGDIDEAVTGPFGALLPRGEYIVALLEGIPTRVEPGEVGDYFYEEQALLEGYDPEDEYNEPLLTNTHYYRLDGRSGFVTAPGWHGENGAGFEFIVPLPQPVDAATSDAHAARMNEGARPTAVSFALLDVKQPYNHDAHWGLVHYLLDGHHKLDAAARLGLPIRLLAFIAVTGGCCNEDHLATFLATYEGAADAPGVSVAPAGG